MHYADSCQGGIRCYELEIMNERASFHGLTVKNSKAFGKAKAKDFSDFKKKYLKADDAQNEYLRNNMQEGYKDIRTIGEPIKPEELSKIIESARLKGVQIGLDGKPYGGFDTYCGDAEVLQGVIDQVAKQFDSNLLVIQG